MAPIGILGALIAMILGLVVLGLVVAYVLVPLFKGVGWLIAGVFRVIGWFVGHIAEFVGGMLSDALRLVGAIITLIVLLPFAPLNVLLGRWSAAGHFAESMTREFRVGGACLYRILLRRPLKLFWLHGILEGVEQRLPEAMAGLKELQSPGTTSLTVMDVYRCLRLKLWDPVEDRMVTFRAATRASAATQC